MYHMIITLSFSQNFVNIDASLSSNGYFEDMFEARQVSFLLCGYFRRYDLEPDILECKIKWALGSITTNKASGGAGIPVELFQILKDDTVKVLHSICQQIWKTQQWLQDWKRSVFIPVPKKGNAKECSSYCTTALISHASKVLKFSKQGFNST